ncbi:DNA internalization-related competence protein ComEC/Rec2 [Pseudoalteromonas sp. NBT06-2]|uniref:DNA internalization-related competence protein ComEC/Rec2 n=1 Tax=Pseudoalteromonas sp. NBT06-2 TaxID=2025950 RepID=UPI00148253E0|nr:DNA internalization-related competence protein ComEC/Rec2 [Pseudoalteromonas sp. NBT06-2]
MSLFQFNTPVFFAIFACILILSLYFKRFRILVLSILAATIYLLAYYHIFYNWELPQYQRGKSYKIDAQVIKIYEPLINTGNNIEHPIYFKAKLLKLDHENIKQTVYINLSWYKNKPQLNVNDTLTANVKVKPFRSLQNFGGANSELWAFYNHVKAKGYIDNKFGIKIIKDNAPDTQKILQQKISTAFIKSINYWFYKAILFGDKSAMPHTYKEKFKIMGISHLFAISGLHIGMMFAIGFYSVKFIIIISMIKPKQKLNINTLYTCTGFIFALTYTLLSGCSISAIRALIMLAVFSFMYIKGAQYFSYRALQYALIISLLINPFQLLNPGIYFSFLAVYILIFSYTKFSMEHNTALKRFSWLVIIQMNLTIGLFPLVWFFNDGASFIGIFVNLIAIPLMALFILPSIVIISFSSLFNLSTSLLLYLDMFLSELFWYLSELEVNVFWLQLGELSWQSLILIYLTLFLSFSSFKFFVYLPVFILLVNKLTEQKSIWQVDILDVGHGLSVLISQNNKTYVYDIGAKYMTGLSIAQTQIIPYIKGKNLTIKHTMLSHRDNDHVGGLQDWINFGLKDTLLINTNLPQEIDTCTLGLMKFGDLKIQNLWPITKSKKSNNNSCVVKVSDDNFSILLPGDIHKNAELELISKSVDLKATILVSPHHGSNTSSSSGFIAAVSPKWVIHSSAFNGRWLMPHSEVMHRYTELGVQQLTTGISGQIRIKFFSDKYLIESTRSKQNYWFLVN